MRYSVGRSRTPKPVEKASVTSSESGNSQKQIEYQQKLEKRKLNREKILTIRAQRPKVAGRRIGGCGCGR